MWLSWDPGWFIWKQPLQKHQQEALGQPKAIRNLWPHHLSSLSTTQLIPGYFQLEGPPGSLRTVTDNMPDIQHGAGPDCRSQSEVQETRARLGV